MADRLAVARRDYIAVLMAANAAYEADMAPAQELWLQASRDALANASRGGEKPSSARISDLVMAEYQGIWQEAQARLVAAVADVQREVTLAVAEAKAAGTFHWDVAEPGETVDWPGCMFCHHPVPGGVEDYPGSGVVCAVEAECDARMLAGAR